MNEEEEEKKNDCVVSPSVDAALLSFVQHKNAVLYSLIYLVNCYRLISMGLIFFQVQSVYNGNRLIARDAHFIFYWLKCTYEHEHAPIHTHNVVYCFFA